MKRYIYYRIYSYVPDVICPKDKRGERQSPNAKHISACYASVSPIRVRHAVHGNWEVEEG